MQRFIITESEKNNIREMYGMLKEQTIPKKPVKDFSEKINGVTLSDGVTYKLPQIENITDLHNFTFVSDSPKEFVSNVVGKGRAFAYPIEPKNDEVSKMVGIRLLRSIREFLSVHAITGRTEPLTLRQLEKLIPVLSKKFKNSNVFTYSPSFLTLLFNPKSGISGDAEAIQNYYQTLLKQKLE